MINDYNDVTDAAQIARVIDGIRQIDAAGLLADFRMTLAKELRALAQRQADANHGRYDPCAGYVADLLHVDRERVEKISVGTRASIVIAEIEVYLRMIEDRARRDADRLGDTRPPIPRASRTESPIVITAAREVPAAVRLAQQRRAAR